jgi:flagellar biosynthesis chaperone FliJ
LIEEKISHNTDYLNKNRQSLAKKVGMMFNQNILMMAKQQQIEELNQEIAEVDEKIKQHTILSEQNDIAIANLTSIHQRFERVTQQKFEELNNTDHYNFDLELAGIDTEVL